MRPLLIEYGGKVAALITFFDITERKLIEQDLKDTAAKNARLSLERTVFSEISRTMSSSLVIDDVYERFAELARKLIDFDRIAIALVDDDRKTFTPSFSSGVPVSDWQGTATPLAGSLAERVMKSGCPAVFDTDELENVPSLLKIAESGLKSVIAVPLSPGPDASGFLYISSREKNAYSNDDLDVAGRIAYRIGDAVSNSVLFENAQKAEQRARDSEEQYKRLAEDSALVAEVGRIVNSSLDIDEVYRRIASEVQRLISYDRLAIGMIDVENQTMTPTFWDGISVPEWETGATLPLTGSLAGRLAANPRGMLLDRDEMDRHPSLDPATKIGITSTIAVPLLSKNEVVGYLAFGSTDRHAYSEHHLKLSQQIGAHVAEAIMNARLFHELSGAENQAREQEQAARESEDQYRQLAYENEIISNIGRIVNTLSIEGIYDQLAEEIHKLVEFDGMRLGFVDEQQGTVAPTYSWGFLEYSSIRLSENRRVLSLDRRMAGEAVDTRSIIRAEKRELGKYDGLEEATNAGVRTFMVVPLIPNDVVEAIIWFSSRRPDAFSAREVSTAQRIADIVSGAIANARMFKELTEGERSVRESAERQRRIAHQNAILGEIGRVVNSSLDMRDVYSQFVAHVSEIVPFDFLNIGFIDERRRRVTYAHSAGMDVAHDPLGTDAPYDGRMSGEAVRTRAVLRVGPDQMDEYGGTAKAVEAGIKAVMTVPIISQDSVIAVLQFASMEADAYGDENVETALRVGEQITGAVANSLTYDELRRVERAVRKSEEQQKNLAHENATLGEIGRIVNSSPDMETVYSQFADRVSKLISFDFLRLGLVDEGRRQVTVAHAMGIDAGLKPPGTVTSYEGHTSGEVIRTQSVLRVGSDQFDKYEGLNKPAEAGIKSIMTVPLISQDSVIAVMWFGSTGRMAIVMMMRPRHEE